MPGEATMLGIPDLRESQMFHKRWKTSSTRRKVQGLPFPTEDPLGLPFSTEDPFVFLRQGNLFNIYKEYVTVARLMVRESSDTTKSPTIMEIFPVYNRSRGNFDQNTLKDLRSGHLQHPHKCHNLAELIDVSNLSRVEYGYLKQSGLKFLPMKSPTRLQNDQEYFYYSHKKWDAVFTGISTNQQQFEKIKRDRRTDGRTDGQTEQGNNNIPELSLESVEFNTFSPTYLTCFKFYRHAGITFHLKMDSSTHIWMLKFTHKGSLFLTKEVTYTAGRVHYLIWIALFNT
eukprot:XP_019924578.1 PREDICTED: uncharacterized protein LOC109619276 [Crassostrea gigas]